jgi:hypothetical protein
MSRYEHSTATTTSSAGHQHNETSISNTNSNSNSNSNGSGLFDNHVACMTSGHEHKYATNDAHLGATTARDAETLSAGSTARNESTTRMMDNPNALEKDFSRQDGKILL